jgi:hypothetical protein
VRRSPIEVIEHLVGMQAQWPPAPYVGIWTRTTGFRRERLERELASGAVVKATLMRQTLHLVTVRDYAVFRAAFSETNHQDKMPTSVKLAPAIRALAAKGPMTMSQAMAYIELEHGLKGAAARRAWRGARVRAHVVHHHESSLWRTPVERRFVAIEEPATPDPTEARAEMLRRYLQAFGPSSRRDMIAWAMLLVPETQRALDLLEPLVRFRDEAGRELLDVEGSPLPAPDTPAPVRFLPKWDNVLLAWADRTRVLPEAYRKAVIKMNGDVAQTFLVDGFVAGTWRMTAGTLHVQPFRPLPARARRAVMEEAERLLAFAGTPEGSGDVHIETP